MTRRFTVEEANAALPRLTMLLERLQRCALELDAERRAEAAARGVAPEAIAASALARSRPAARALVEELSGVVEEIDDLGAQLKDIRLGLVDFPAHLDGEPVLLCWQFGETQVAFWHGEGDGFAGRRALAGVAACRVLQ